MNKECGVCKHYKYHNIDGYCENPESRQYRKHKLEIEVCGNFELPHIEPCPFCGGEGAIATIHYGRSGNRRAKPCIRCRNCGTKSVWFDIEPEGSMNDKLLQAIDMWNRRYDGETA